MGRGGEEGGVAAGLRSRRVPRRRPAPAGERRLSLAEAQFYASVYDPARRGSLAELRRRGCEEHEAEELFAAAYARVMESVDPIERRFSAPQMVRFVKRACTRRLIDERRRERRDRPEEEARDSRAESPAEAPAEAAEEREAVAIGREALAMLPERDRLIFTWRHLQELAPEEILARMPGLGMRTYRKVLQRANARVLEAYRRIEAGERCAEMRAGPLRRRVTGESPPAELRAVEAHLAHCRACRQSCARMRGYLLDVASGALLASSLASGIPSARLLELASRGARALGEASRSARERLREALLRLFGSLHGPGADAGVSQALGAGSWRIASVCGAGLAAGACVAAGALPGIGGVGLASRHHDRPAPPVRTKPATASRIGGASEPATPTPEKTVAKGASASAPAPVRHFGASSSESRHAVPQGRPASAPLASGDQVAAEFGAESSRPPTGEASPSTSTSPSSQSPSVSGAAEVKSERPSTGNAPRSESRPASEFGM